MEIKKILIYIGVGLLVLGLGAYAYLGIFNRYYADDWCYNKDLNRLGLIGALEGYTYIGTYASNRYSLTLFSGLIYFLGIFGVQIMTPLAIILWLVGIYWTLQNLNKITDRCFSPWLVFLISAVLLYFSLHLAPHLYQNFYWRSGLLPYTAPLVFIPYTSGLITWRILRPAKLSLPTMIAAALLALIVGGFSEAAATFYVAAAGIYFLATLVGMWRKRGWAAKSVGMAGVALGFAVLALILEIASPANAARQAHSYGEPTALLELPGQVLIYTYYFIRVTTSAQAVPFSVLFGISFSLGYLAWEAHDHRPAGSQFQEAFFGALFTGLVTFSLVAASLTPSLYIQGSLPTVRAEIIPIFTLITATVTLGSAFGIFLRRNIHQKWLDLAAVLILGITLVFIAQSIVMTFDKAEIYKERAEIWDERDAYIRYAANEGLEKIEVRGIDSAPIGGLHDIKSNPHHWVNRCAAHYYGAKMIEATE